MPTQPAPFSCPLFPQSHLPHYISGPLASFGLSRARFLPRTGVFSLLSPQPWAPCPALCLLAFLLFLSWFPYTSWERFPDHTVLHSSPHNSLLTPFFCFFITCMTPGNYFIKLSDKKQDHRCLHPLWLISHQKGSSIVDGWYLIHSCIPRESLNKCLLLVCYGPGL